MTLSEQIAWTRDVLEHLYDLAYLRQAVESSSGKISVYDARDLQCAVFDRIQLLKPTTDIAISSLAWRIYNTIDLRYVRGMTQLEAASELNISLRQLRREQDRGIEAIATLVFSNDTSATNTSHPRDTAPTSIGENEFLRLDDLLHGVLSLIDPLLSSKNTHVQVRIPIPAPVFWTNRTAIRQLLIMLVSRIIQHASGGILLINGQTEGRYLHVELCTASIERHAPEPQMATIKDDDQVPVNTLAQDAGIEIHIAANDDVRIRVPISDRQRILLVDDNPDNVTLTERFLENSPYDLVTVNGAEDALIQAQTLQPSCIILDVMMPGRDGWEILALLKSHPETIRIPVIVCSVLRNQDLARALGAAATLSRPHTSNQLFETLHTVIEASHPHLAVQSALAQ